jgi:hypothetical protein
LEIRPRQKSSMNSTRNSTREKGGPGASAPRRQARKKPPPPEATAAATAAAIAAAEAADASRHPRPGGEGWVGWRVRNLAGRALLAWEQTSASEMSGECTDDLRSSMATMEQLENECKGDEDCRRVFDAFEDAYQSAGDHCDDRGWRHADDTDCPGLGAATDAAADATGCCDESGCAAYCES